MLSLRFSFRSLAFVLSVLLLTSCGGGGSNDPETLETISGIIIDDPVVSANVEITDLEGNTLGSSTTDDSGRYSLEIESNSLNSGFKVTATGGMINGSDFEGTLKGIYSDSDTRTEINATIITTLVTMLSELETNGSLLEKRNSVINRLKGIGVINNDWNQASPTGIDLQQLRASIESEGFAITVSTLVDDLKDNDVSMMSMEYFPSAHGGITSIRQGDDNGNVSAHRGTIIESKISFSTENTTDLFSFELIDAPNWMSVDSNGVITIAIPADIQVGNVYPYRIKITNESDSLFRIIEASIHVMSEGLVAQETLTSIGGVVTNPEGNIGIEVPMGAVSGNGTFSIRVGRNIDGDPSIYIEAPDSLNSEYEIVLPAPELFEHVTPEAPTQNVTNRSARTGNSIQKRSAAKSAIPLDGGNAKCEDESNHPTMSHCWTSTAAYFLDSIGFDEILGQARVRKMGTFSTKLNRLRLDKRTASQLWSSVDMDDVSLSTKEPVLFIHGFGIGFTGFGGGTDTWGEFHNLMSSYNSQSTEYIPFDFQWLTNARFRDVADDLGDAIRLINRKTGQKVHIVAHSFGGLVARTLLQGLSASEQDVGNLVASLTTLGTPHSGIADSIKQLHNVYFPGGQDNWNFELCRQQSCYEAGEWVSIINKGFLGLDDEPGEAVSDLSDLVTNPLPSGLNVQSLMGITKNISLYLGPINFRFELNSEAGDALISYEGQRFMPSLTVEQTSGTNLNDPLPLLERRSVGGAEVTEEVLDDAGRTDLKPNDTLWTFTGTFRELKTLDFFNEYKDEGYRHTTKSGVQSVRGWKEQVNLDCDNSQNCDHQGWKKVTSFITANPSAPAATATFQATLNIEDEIGTPVNGVLVFVTANETTASPGFNVTDSTGAVTLQLKFEPNTPYKTVILAPEPYRSVQRNLFTTDDTLSSKVINLTIPYKAVQNGSIGISVIDNIANPVTNVGFVVRNSTGVTVDSGTSNTGIINITAAADQYSITLKRDGYFEKTVDFYISQASGSALQITLDNGYSLTLSKSDVTNGNVTSNPGGISCGTGCSTDSALFASQSTLTLTAIASIGYTFNGWTGCDSETATTCTVTMNSDRTVSASFVPVVQSNYTLTINKSGASHGTVIGSDALGNSINCGSNCSAQFDEGSIVTLTAIAGSSYEFDSWQGCTTILDTTCSVNMNSNQTISATFLPVNPTSYTLTLNKPDETNGTVTSSPVGISCISGCSTDSASFDSSSVVTLTAVAANDYAFDGWTGCDTETATTCTVSMNGNRTVSASFTSIVVVGPFDGSYGVAAVSTTSTGIGGFVCTDALGIMDIIDSQLSGYVIDGYQDTYQISGNVDVNGDVTGGFASGNLNTATFEGAFNGDNASGTWVDIAQCEGTWTAIKN